MPPDKLAAFIPKTLPDQPIRTRSTLGILTFFGMALFLISLGLSGAVFFYKQIATRQVSELDKSLKRLEADFEPPLIAQLIQTASTVNSAKELLAKHRAVSKVFDFLEANTLQNVRFSNFSFNALQGETELTGQAES